MKADECDTMGCPMCGICNEISQDNNVASVVKTSLPLSLVEQFTNLLVVVKPTNKACFQFSNITSCAIHLEVVTKDKLWLVSPAIWGPHPWLTLHENLAALLASSICVGGNINYLSTVLSLNVINDLLKLISHCSTIFVVCSDLHELQHIWLNNSGQSICPYKYN